MHNIRFWLLRDQASHFLQAAKHIQEKNARGLLLEGVLREGAHIPLTTSSNLLFPLYSGHNLVWAEQQRCKHVHWNTPRTQQQKKHLQVKEDLIDYSNIPQVEADDCLRDVFHLSFSCYLLLSPWQPSGFTPSTGIWWRLWKSLHWDERHACRRKPQAAPHWPQICPGLLTVDQLWPERHTVNIRYWTKSCCSAQHFVFAGSGAGLSGLQT